MTLMRRKKPVIQHSLKLPFWMIETDRCPYQYSTEQLLPLTKKKLCSWTQQLLLLENSFSFGLLMRPFLSILDFACCHPAITPSSQARLCLSYQFCQQGWQKAKEKLSSVVLGRLMSPCVPDPLTAEVGVVVCPVGGPSLNQPTAFPRLSLQ